MAADGSIVEDSATYIRIEAIANIFGGLFGFASVGLITFGKAGFVYILTGIKLILCLLSDAFLVSPLDCSANSGVNGIGVSKIMPNIKDFLLSTTSGKACREKETVWTTA